MEKKEIKWRELCIIWLAVYCCIASNNPSIIWISMNRYNCICKFTSNYDHQICTHMTISNGKTQWIFWYTTISHQNLLPIKNACLSYLWLVYAVCSMESILQKWNGQNEKKKLIMTRLISQLSLQNSAAGWCKIAKQKWMAFDVRFALKYIFVMSSDQI